MRNRWILWAVTLFLLGTPVLASAADRSGREGDLRQIAKHSVYEQGKHERRELRHDDHREWKQTRHDNRRHDDRAVARHRHDEHRSWRGEYRHRHPEPRVVYRYAPPPRPIVRERVVLSPVIPPPSSYLVLHFSW